MKNKLILVLAIGVVVFVVILLATGSPLLNRSIAGDDGVPMGTVLTWLTFICLPLVFLLGIPGLRHPKTNMQRWIRKAFGVLFALGLLWGLVSYGLAGNWSFNFKRQVAFRGSARAGVLFWYMNYFLAIVPIMLVSFLSLEAILKNLRRSK